MIERVKGLIEKKGSNSVILVVNGIGLEINMSINALESLPPVGKEIQVLTFLNVREDLLELYGFVNRLERKTFLLLISISGIGPKLALTILSGISTDNLKNSIIAGDVPSLTRIPGVGSKTAKRIIIELKEKFITIDRDQLGIAEEKQIITVNAENENHSQARFASLDKNIIEPLEKQWGFIEVEKVGRNISEAVEGYLERNHQQKRFKGFDWEFKLIQDDAANAWCMPGGKICFYTGILEYTKDENGLAVVMGHEIAHAIARHGNERMSKAIAAQMGGVALSVALMNQSTQTQELFKEAYGISSGLSGLAFSRRNELESDKLGLVFMHLAGYDATKAPDFWVRMTQNKQQIPAFLSTHPSGDKRIEEIRSFLASEKFQKYTSK